jgi:hypothetical protein
MTATVTARVVQIVSVPPASSARAISSSRRISPQAGRALEILGHAIDYLIDETIYDGPFSRLDPRLQAVRLLVAANRAVYFACPEVPTLRQRCRSLLQQWTA